MKKNKNKSLIVLTLVLCCCILFSFSATAFANTDVTGYLNDTYAYEKGSDGVVLSDAEAKSALKADTDLLILGAGRDLSSGAVTAGEFSKYLGYVNANLRNGNGSYTLDDFLRAALAVGTCGNASNVGKDVNGNTVDLLYKGLYPYSYNTISQSPARLANALLAVNANGIPNSILTKVTRSQLKQGVMNAVKAQAQSGSLDVYTSALLLQAMAPYYRSHEAAATEACDKLLAQLATKIGSTGAFNNSCRDTAMMVTALCEMGIDPEDNPFFSKNVLSGLLSFKQSGSGFAAATGGAVDKNATNYGRIALVAYRCYENGQHFYTYDSCKDYNIAQIAVNTDSKNNSSKNSTSKKSGSGSKSSKSTKSNNNSSSSNSSNSSNSSSSNSSGSSIVKHAAASGTTVTKAEFEKIKGQNTTLIYEGTWGESEPYTISFSGKNITEAKDFNAELSADIEHQTEIEAVTGQPEYFRFLQKGSFPGKATATLTVSLADGSYQCYHYNDDTGKFESIGNAIVNNGMASFEVSAGGDYFLTSSEEDGVDESGQFMKLSDTVDGIVPKSVFEGIMDKDVDLTLDGETDRNIFYSIVFRGKDIDNPMDFNMILSESTPNKDDIAELTDSPILLHFEQDGEIPGDATVTVYSNLDASETYGLYYYNEESKEGEFIGNIVVGDGEFTFMITHCCDYFIAKGESSAVLKKSVSIGLIILLVILAILLAGGIGGYFFLRKKGISLKELLTGKGKKRKTKQTKKAPAVLPESEQNNSEAENDTLDGSETAGMTDTADTADTVDTVDIVDTDGVDDSGADIVENDETESFAEPVEEKVFSESEYGDIIRELSSDPRPETDIDSFARPEKE